VTRRELAEAFLRAVLRQETYAPQGFESCVACFDVPEDDAGRRCVYAEALDLGLALGDALELARRAGEAGALDLVVRVGGTPFCEQCAARLAGFVLAGVAHRAPPACPCAAIPGLVDLFSPAGLGPWAFSFGLVFGDECRRCEVCRAMARGRPEQRG
jgi:hypothetical protein